MAEIVDISRTRAAAQSRTAVGEPEGGPFGDEMEVAIGVEQGRIGIDGDSRDQAVHETRHRGSRRYVQPLFTSRVALEGHHPRRTTSP